MSASTTSSSAAVSVIDMVLSEHRAVEQQYSDFKASSDVAVKQQKLHWLIKLLSEHGAKEEMALYPVMRTKLPDGENLVKHAIDDHQQLKVDLARVDGMKVGEDPSLEADLEKLMKDLMHHVKEEENDNLPALQKACTQQELIDIGKAYQQAQMIAPSHPHPMAPVGEVSGKLANMGGKAADAAYDKIQRPEVMKEDVKSAGEAHSGTHPIR